MDGESRKREREWKLTLKVLKNGGETEVLVVGD